MESALIVPMNSSRGLQQRPSKSKGLLHEAGRVLIGHKRTFVLIADELILRLQPICYRITLASIQDSGLINFVAQTSSFRWGSSHALHFTLPRNGPRALRKVGLDKICLIACAILSRTSETIARTQ